MDKAIKPVAEDEVSKARRQLLGDMIVDDKDSPVASAARVSFRLGWDAALESLNMKPPEISVRLCDHGYAICAPCNFVPPSWKPDR